MITQGYSDIFRSLCKLGNFRTLVYSESQYIQDLKHIRNPVKHLRWSVLRKNSRFFLALFSNMANCDLSKTVRKELKLMFNIRKPDRFHKKVSFLLKKSSLPFKIVNLDGFRLIQRTLFGLAEFSCLYKVALRSNKLVMK